METRRVLKRLASIGASIVLSFILSACGGAIDRYQGPDAQCIPQEGQEYSCVWIGSENPYNRLPFSFEAECSSDPEDEELLYCTAPDIFTGEIQFDAEEVPPDQR